MSQINKAFVFFLLKRSNAIYSSVWKLCSFFLLQKWKHSISTRPAEKINSFMLRTPLLLWFFFIITHKITTCLPTSQRKHFMPSPHVMPSAGVLTLGFFLDKTWFKKSQRLVSSKSWQQDLKTWLKKTYFRSVRLVVKLLKRLMNR